MNEGPIHPTREQLAAFAHGKLVSAELQAIETHVGGCDTCCDVLRSIPDDELVERVRGVGLATDNTAIVGEAGIPASDAPLGEATSAIPRMLIDHPRYEIVKQLGTGGMGVVYQAKHRLMGRTVALKVIRGKLLKNAAAIERFRQEVKAAARLSHRNIVTAYDAEQAGDVHFLIMEFVAGTDLASVVKNRGPLPIMHACNYAMQAAQGLQHAHEQGMVHRDIKPQNLMVTPKGAVKILDFGLARLATRNNDEGEDAGLTREGATLGTPDFIAPEQARDSRRADIRSDIYSLGCTLYYLLTGVVPFPLGTAMEKVISHCERSPMPLADLRDDIPLKLVQIVERMMAKDPTSRLQTPKEVIEALRPFAVAKSNADAPLAIESTRVELASPIRHLQPDIRPGEPNSAPTSPAISIDTEEYGQEHKHSFNHAIRSWRTRLRRHRTSVSIAAVTLVAIAAAAAGLRFTNNSDGQVPTRTKDTEGWVDLMPNIDPSRQAIAGTWRRRGKELDVDSAASARLQLPAPPSDEYDFEVEFTRHDGSHSIALMFVVGAGQATFEIDAWDEQIAGIQLINGRDMRDNETRTVIAPLENGRSYTALVQVRRGRVDGYLDGKRLASYRGDGSDLSPLELWRLPNSQCLGLGAYLSATTFHRIRVRRVGD